MDGNSHSQEESGSREPLDDWREGEVWFREWIPKSSPWGSEELLEAVPEEAKGHYGLKVASAAEADGQRYVAGEFVVVDTMDEMVRLASTLGGAEGLLFPWYDRLVPGALIAPHHQRIDLARYRSDLSARFFKALAIIGAGIVASLFLPDLQMLILLMAAFYGLFPMVDSGLGWLRRVDRLSVSDLNRQLVTYEFFRRWLETRRSRTLTVGLVVLGLVFVGQRWAGLNHSIEAAALVKAQVLQGGEWWRIVTTGLMHGSELHLLFNAMALYSLGRILTALVSPSLMSIVFLFTVVTGSLASLWMGPGLASVGASGGILGCLGFLLVVTTKFRDELPGYLRSNLLQATLVIALFGLLGSSFIDNAAHAGGLFGGIVLGAVCFPWLRLAPSKAHLITRIAAFFSLLILGAGVLKIAQELF